MLSSSGIVMSCSRPCGARRCRRPISRTPPSCLAGQDALAKHDAGLAYAKLTERGVGHWAGSEDTYPPKPGLNAVDYTRLRLALVPIPRSWQLCISHTHTLMHHTASYRIILQSINHISCCFAYVLPTC